MSRQLGMISRWYDMLDLIWRNWMEIRSLFIYMSQQYFCQDKSSARKDLLTSLNRGKLVEIRLNFIISPGCATQKHCSTMWCPHATGIFTMIYCDIRWVLLKFNDTQFSCCQKFEKPRIEDGMKMRMKMVTLEISQLSKWLEKVEHSLECPGRGGGGRRNSGGAGGTGGPASNLGGPGPVTRWPPSSITRCWSSTYLS